MIQSIEKQIVRSVVAALIAAGHNFTVDYERGYDPTEITEKDSIDAIIEAAFAVDECWFMIDRDGDTFDTFIYFIWGNGNDGRDCISDYGTSLEAILSPIIEQADNA